MDYKNITESLSEMQYRKMIARNNILVSVFMLTHNREKYLRLAVDSVLKQTYGDFVLWILNNSSTDHTEEYLAEIKDERVIYSNTDVEPYENMRFVKNICGTRYFIILHDDDIVEGNYLEEALSCMEKGMYDELFVGAVLIDSNGNWNLSNNKKCFDGKENVFHGEQYFWHFFGCRDDKKKSYVSFPFPSVVYRTSFYQKIGEVFTSDAGPASDQLVHFATERNGGTICFLAKQLFQYRIHEEQDSQINLGFMDLMLLDYLLSEKYYRKLLEENKSVLRKRLWVIYRAIVCKACRGQMDRRKWESFFSYGCIKNLRTDLPGKLSYVGMRLIFHMPHVMKLIYRIVKKE